MPVNYLIAADVVDITVDKPKKSDTFLVDSNVWFWYAYTKASMGSPAYQISAYPGYLKQCMAVQSTLIKTGLSLSELAHIIERTELDIYSANTGFNKANRKEYRHNFPVERKNVVAEIESVWNQIDPIAIQMEVRVEESLTRTALSRLKRECLDGYDCLTVEALSKTAFSSVLTDDGDFATVKGLTVFTANRNVIQQAKSQGSLVVR